ncbi:a disintegrin and metalloproteinase with thrombospondin motifs 6 [Caerostris darwini]|uniref:A disintegrin and metalloproteinase with thrombospondin motifs 6 n=1 Tax=Caerostris darwini TaxID=1538125 RepID=A0AAV4T1T3_9ARAC|nr:a disintegrin and metalloproteinase with thrombospondin motifs 6 [Caerostris darwini]
MDLSELRKTFNVDSYDEVPEYEIIHLQMLSNRNVNGNEEKSITFFTFGREISLKMQEDNELNNRICSGKMYKMNLTNIEEIFIEEGSVGSLQIKPVTVNVRIFESDFNNEIANFSRSEAKSFNVPKSAAHLIIKVQELLNNTRMDVENSDCQVNTAVESSSRRRSKRQVSVVYPEILLVVDYDSFAHFSYNEKRVRNYYYYILNSMDSKFRSLTNPSIKISLSALLITKSRTKIPFLEQNRLSSDQNRVNTSKTVRDFSNYLHKNRHNFRPFDIALIMTKVSQCIEQSFGRCKVHVDGLAFGTACKKNTNHHGVGIIHDFGGQRTVSIAMHEVGHLLGALHDGSASAAHCPVKKGYIMDPGVLTGSEWIWSQCSKQQMRCFLNSPDAKCLHNYAEKRF